MLTRHCHLALLPLAIVAIAAVLPIPLAAQLTIKPLDTETFFVTPEKNTTLRWRIDNTPPKDAKDATPAPVPDTIAYSITDYHGNPVPASSPLLSFPPAATVKDGIASLTLALPQGYYEITFPLLAPAAPSSTGTHASAVRPTFGIVSIPAFDREQLDPYFCVDSALSWLERSGDQRRSLIRMMRRSGIALSRERFSWQRLRPAPGTWNWSGAAPLQYDRLRQLYAREEMPLLDCFHDAPKWMENPGSYPVDLLTATDDLTTIARRWSHNWGALELWNETDTAYFSGDRPIDQYTPFVHATAWTWTRANLKPPLGGAAFAGFKQHIADNAIRNGLLDSLDFVTYHNYSNPETALSSVRTYRTWTATGGRPHIPLWITESGRPWIEEKGSGRAPLAADKNSAVNITGRVAEMKALGIARIFPFVMPYYPETGKNFGMVGKDGTPLRSLGCYAYAIKTLANRACIGDLRLPQNPPKTTPAILLARVFSYPESDDAVAMLWSGPETAPGASIALDLPLEAIREVRGIDGRLLDRKNNNHIPLTDGLTWVHLDRRSLEKSGNLIVDTEAMRLLGLAHQPDPGRLPPSPVVLQFTPDPTRLTFAPEVCLINLGSLESVPIDIRAVNLDSGNAQTLTVSLHAGALPGDVNIPVGAPQTVTLPPRSQKTLNWRANLGPLLKHTTGLTLRTDSSYAPDSAAASTKIVPLSIDFLVEKTLPDLIELYGKKLPLPVTDTDRWNKTYINQRVGGSLTITAEDKKLTRIEVAFEKRGTEWDYWAYPRFNLPSGTDLRGAAGLLLRARVARPAPVRLFVWKPGDVGYYTASPIIPQDGEWHAIMIPFGKLSHNGDNKPDTDSNLVDHLERVTQLSLGMNMKQSTNTLEISDVIVVWPK
ncbi:MAG: hypothetical protein LBK99_05010 [Opitutaceae bacterium]|jgi:hypothetical protein|nr:hypothetical protein [Opitutaceae bacterium]